MRKKETIKIKPTKSDQSLRITAIIVTALFAVLILFPFALTISNAVKDNAKIYDVPPKLIPDSAQSLQIVVDYTGIAEDVETLEKTIQGDMISTMFGIYTKLNRESIFKVNFYGVKDGKTIFHSKAHQVQLQLEKDYGTYKGVVLNKETLFYKDRIQTVANKIGYDFNPRGLKKPITPKITKAEALEMVYPIFEDTFTLEGQLATSYMKRNNWLLAESFIHYMKLPQYVYSNNETIAKYGFMVFVGNTSIVIGFAIFSQVLLCSICGFVTSYLMGPRSAKAVILFFLGAMMVPFVSIMLPQLIMYKEMGAYNNYAALLLPFLYPFGFFIYLFKGFFDRIPKSFFEAAQLDGASNFYLYTKICMPLSKPIISLIALQVFLGNWNDFFWAWLVTERQDLWTLNVALYSISNDPSTKQNALMGIALITILPVIIATIIFSKQLKEGIMSSGVKG